MCYDDQARPPMPPGASNPATGEDMVLTASDGNRFAAYYAAPTNPSNAQILIYPDVRGLHQFYKELALRFAEVGITALALDYFGRTAGLTPRDDSFDFRPHVMQIQLATFLADVQASKDYLVSKTNPTTPTFVVGFCMGGSFTLLSGTQPQLGFAGLLPFYANLSRNLGGQGSVLDNASKVAYPVVGFFAGEDQGIPESEVTQLGQTLTASGVEHKLNVYAGAPHSFFDRRSVEFAEASADAWQQALDFIKAHSSPVAVS
jgi:carboxymethylenebutenolidase